MFDIFSDQRGIKETLKALIEEEASECSRTDTVEAVVLIFHIT